MIYLLCSCEYFLTGVWYKLSIHSNSKKGIFFYLGNIHVFLLIEMDVLTN